MENEIFGKEEKIDFFTRVYKIKIVAESYNNEMSKEKLIVNLKIIMKNY